MQTLAALSTALSTLDVEGPGTTHRAPTPAEAVQELKSLGKVERPHYSGAVALAEQPFTHYAPTGAVIDILALGIQSKNFAAQAKDLEGQTVNGVALSTLITAHRKTSHGATYQTGDSISLSKFDPKPYAGSSKVIFLVDPSLAVTDGPRISTGYGHGIEGQRVGDYWIGNGTAYKDEVLAAGIILPRDLRAILVPPYTSFISGFTMRLNAAASGLTESGKQDPESAVAPLRLLAEIQGLTAEFSERITSATTRLAEPGPGANRGKELVEIGKELLARFCGGTATEEKFRAALSSHFGITLIDYAPSKGIES